MGVIDLTEKKIVFGYSKDKILKEGSDNKGGSNPGKVPPRPTTPPPVARKKKT